MAGNNSSKLLIPDLPLISDYPEILKAAESGQLLIFVGAGVSRIIGGPSWQDLSWKYLKFVHEECGITYSEYKHLKKQDARKLLSICSELAKRKGKAFDFEKHLETDVEAQTNLSYKKYSDLFQIIDDFNCPVLTTNFDDFLDREYSSPPSVKESASQKNIKKSKNIIYHFDDVPAPDILKSGDVVHLHGSIHDKKNRSLVLTIKDYFKAYSRDQKGKKKQTYLPDFLTDLFKEKVVLFMGYGLEEFEVLEFIVNNNENVTEKRHYILYPFLGEEGNIVHLQETYYSQLGVNLIPYSISKVGYGQLYSVLKDWSNEVGKKSKNKNFIDDLSMLDSI